VKRRALLLPLALLAACGSDGSGNVRSDWETRNAARLARESESAAPAVLPAYPRPEALVAFDVPALPEFRFHVDASTLSVGDGIVRYAVVGRSASGAENVAYEAINCRSAEYRVYAIGRGATGGGRWQPQEQAWRAIDRRSVQRVLMNDYFCPQRVSIASAAEGAMALRRGGHPLRDAQKD
jgi:hypothetical protein